MANYEQKTHIMLFFCLHDKSMIKILIVMNLTVYQSLKFIAFFFSIVNITKNFTRLVNYKFN